MEERDKCKLHHKEGIRLICQEKSCNLQPLCPMCVPKHFKHAIVNIEEYWKEKLQEIGSANIEGEKVKEEMKDPSIQDKDNILTTCGEMKKFILDWGRKLEIKISRSISSDVRSMIKSINNYEEKIINNIQENHLDLKNIIEYGEQNKMYKNKMKKALNSSRFSLLSRYYRELTKREKERKDIIEKMKKDRKNMRSEIIMEEMKKKTEKGGEILFEHINQIIKREEITLKVPDIEKVKKAEEKKVENIPKVEEKKVKILENIPKVEERPKRLEGILSASDDQSLILWDKNYKQRSTYKGKSKYSKLIELSSGGIAATTGPPDNAVELLGNNLELLCTLRGHTSDIYDICNKGENHVITGSWDQAMRMWDIRSGKCTQILRGHRGWVCCVHLHRSSGYLLTGSYDHTVRIWDITSPHTYNQMAQILHPTCVYDLVELDAGRMLSICAGSSSLGVKVWELRWKVNTLSDIPPPEQERWGFICGLEIFGTKGVLLGGWYGNLMLLDLTSYALTPLIHKLHQGKIMQIKELKDHIYVTCSEDKSIKIVNVVTKEVIQTLLGHTGWVKSILPIFAKEQLGIHGRGGREDI